MPSAARGTALLSGSSPQFTSTTVHQRGAPSTTQARGGASRCTLHRPRPPPAPRPLPTRTASTLSPPQFSLSGATRYGLLFPPLAAPWRRRIPAVSPLFALPASPAA